MSQAESCSAGKIVLAVGLVAVVTALIPSSEGLEPEWLKAVQRKVGTRRAWAPPAWPGDFNRSGLRMATEQALLNVLEPVFEMCRVNHPEGSAL